MPDEIDLTKYIRSISDWPKKGVLFRDITPLLADPKAFSMAIEALCVDFTNACIDYVAAVEARGFMFGASVAEKIGVGFVPIRKKGKLPSQTKSVTYDLEYGTGTLQVHSDAITSGANVLMIDDVLATGGTMAAACELIEKISGNIVGISFLMELCDLRGREKLTDYKVHSILTY